MEHPVYLFTTTSACDPTLSGIQAHICLGNPSRTLIRKPPQKHLSKKKRDRKKRKVAAAVALILSTAAKKKKIVVAIVAAAKKELNGASAQSGQPTTSLARAVEKSKRKEVECKLEENATQNDVSSIQPASNRTVPASTGAAAKQADHGSHSQSDEPKDKTLEERPKTSLTKALEASMQS